MADSMERCRKLPTMQDGAQWADLKARVDVFEEKIMNVEDTVEDSTPEQQNFCVILVNRESMFDFITMSRKFTLLTESSFL
ncbi:hypothetical protein E4U15_007006 [Claviceps sp. LM218 group G6]|nr:hypothetical protein E4U15_007006 [Claviceps sp. LM218 group G6]